MTDQASVVSRGGVVLAVSSGLVAGVGLPATTSHSAAETGPPTASASLASPVRQDLAPSPVAAATTARVAFDHSAFWASPRPRPIHKTTTHRRPAHAAPVHPVVPAIRNAPAHRAAPPKSTTTRTPTSTTTAA
ncbi:MAG: hypothetical protein ACXV0U_09605, partial [Kineosporiaceae bacterium]